MEVETSGPVMMLSCLDLFLSFDTSICSGVENSDHVIISVFINFPSNGNGGAHFYTTNLNFSHTHWNDLRDYFRNVPLVNIFKLGTSPAASEFRDWSRL